MNALSVDYDWQRAKTASPLSVGYQGLLEGYIHASSEVPAVYRWALFRGAENPYSIYVGETENLRRRLRSYLRPGKRQKTNVRLRTLFESELKNGFKLELHLIRIVPFQMNDVLVSNYALHNPYVRGMVENFVLANHQDPNCEILNLKMNPIERRKRKAVDLLDKLTPEQRTSVFEVIDKRGLLSPKR
jgi:hypothetical protein